MHSGRGCKSAARLAMADAIVYATAKDQEAEVSRGAADLNDLPGVVYVR